VSLRPTQFNLVRIVNLAQSTRLCSGPRRPWSTWKKTH